MGILDRLNAAKRHVWSPITLSMLERGSDKVVHAGRVAKVVVVVEGEDDGTAERVEVTLALNISATVWLVGEVPTTIGRHELEFEIPVEAPPSSPWTRYTFRGVLHRTKGVQSEAQSPVDVVGSPDHVYWPEGPRSGSDDPGVAIELDAETITVGDPVSGRVAGAAGAKVEIGTLVDSLVHVEGKSKGEQKQVFDAVATATTDASGAFSVPIAAGAPPTLHNGHSTWITWEVRAAGAWHRFALLDPEALGAGELERTSLASLLT